VDGSTLSLLATDMTGNACIFAYDPKSSESWKGQKLLTKSAFHVGSPVHRMVRFRLKVGLGLLACSLPPTVFNLTLCCICTPVTHRLGRTVHQTNMVTQSSPPVFGR